MSDQRVWIIRHQSERYPFGVIDRETQEPVPETVVVTGSLAQAEWVAECLSNWFSGCDYFYAVENDPKELEAEAETEADVVARNAPAMKLVDNFMRGAFPVHDYVRPLPLVPLVGKYPCSCGAELFEGSCVSRYVVATRVQHTREKCFTTDNPGNCEIRYPVND